MENQKVNRHHFAEPPKDKSTDPIHESGPDVRKGPFEVSDLERKHPFTALAALQRALYDFWAWNGVGYKANDHLGHESKVKSE